MKCGVWRRPKKTCSLDPMPATLLVSCLDELLALATCILNSSLASVAFRPNGKMLLWIRVWKKAGKDICFANLHPVSNLRFNSKLTERAVYDQIHEHMMKFELHLLPDLLLQSAYRAGHSTETALLKVARSDFWVTIPFNFEGLEHHRYQFNRKSNDPSVLEKD